MSVFNLLDDAWLKVRWREHAEIAEVSVRDALLNAHKIDGLVVDLPTQLPAVMRQVLLPIVLDALDPPVDRKTWGRRFAAGEFSPQERDTLLGYLDEHRSRFDLFDERQPFAQVGGLTTKNGDTKGSALLVATAATGNNVPLFASRTEGDPLPLPPAHAALWLLHAQCWDTAAIKTGAKDDPQAKAGKTTGNPTGPLGQLGVLMPTGRTLYETIMLNLPIGLPAIKGTPQWRRKPAGAAWETRAEDGVLDLWTWQARRIRLIPEETPAGLRVPRVLVCAGDRLSRVSEREPHTAWTFQKAPKSRTGLERKPRRHMPGRAIWRGLDALLATEPTRIGAGTYETSVLLKQIADLQEEGHIPETYPLGLETYGMTYGNQSAVVEDIVHDSVPLPVRALRGNDDVHALLIEVTQQAEQIAQAVNHLSADLRRAVGADPIPWDKGQRPGELVLHALDPLVRRLLAGVRDSSDDEEKLERGQLAWEQLAYRKTWDVAEPLFATTPPLVFAGRERTQGKSTMTYRLGTAELGFRRALNQILPRAAAARREGRE